MNHQERLQRFSLALPQRLILRVLVVYRRGDPWPQRKLIRGTLHALDVWAKWDGRARRFLTGASEGMPR